MTNTTRNVLIACGVLFMVACACIGLIILVGSSIWIVDREIVAEEIATSTPSQSDAQESVVTEDANGGEMQREMDQIQQQVIELRGLQPVRDVKRSLLTPEELRERVINDFLEDYSEEEAYEDAIVMAAFNLLDFNFNLIDFYIELFSEQIAGFYDDESEEMFVVRGSGFQGPERLTYAHEYVHVLQDQNYDIEHGLNYTDELCETDSERCAAIQALLEGDASLLELKWFAEYATKEDQSEIIDFYGQFKSPIYDSAPDFMKQDFIFPYQAGQAFVEYLYESGGWDAVSDAYENPPVSTEQVLHPERFPDDDPVTVDLPDLSEVLGQGWRELDRGVMGEWSTYLILGYGMDVSARLSDQDAKSAVDGWGGDAYVVYYDDKGNTVIVLQAIWDTLLEANEFSDQFENYARSRFGDPNHSQPDLLAWENLTNYTEFHKEGIETTWISAPDGAIVSAIWELISKNP
jgi:hypothetical protein